MQIRRALPQEADALTSIALAAKRHWGYPERWIEIWTPLLTFKPEDIQTADVFAAVIEGEIAGFCRLFLRGQHGILEDLWVKPKFIGQGVGQTLFEHVFLHCKRADVRILEVEADPHAQGFYEKMGMVKVRERHTEVDGQPRILPILEMEL